MYTGDGTTEESQISEQYEDGLRILARIIARKLLGDAENAEAMIGETCLPVANLEEAT